MPGPLPKNFLLKQGKKSASGRSVVLVETAPLRRPPPLPAHPTKEKWHALAREFWRDTWASPMAENFLLSDVHGLLRMAVLVDRFMKSPSAAVSAELRLMSAAYGLSPIDRMRLRWHTVTAEEAVDAAERKRTKRARIVDMDPRDALGQ